MELRPCSDSLLMQQIQQGNQQAFIALVHKYQHPLYNFFWFMNCSPTESEDLVQEVFLRLFRCCANYRPKAKFSTFLYTIARRAWIDHLRKDQRHRHRKLEQANDIADPNEYQLALENKIDVQNALGQLSEKLRSVLVLAIYQQLKYQEIAEVLAIPVGTVKSRMYLALRQLQEIFSERNIEQTV